MMDWDDASAQVGGPSDDGELGWVGVLAHLNGLIDRAVWVYIGPRGGPRNSVASFGGRLGRDVGGSIHFREGISSGAALFSIGLVSHDGVVHYIGYFLLDEHDLVSATLCDGVLDIRLPDVSIAVEEVE